METYIKSMMNFCRLTSHQNATYKTSKRSILILIVISSLIGCTGSNLELASDSRLPKWFTLADGVRRDDVKVTITYYFKPSGRYAVFKIVSSDESYTEKIHGRLRGPYPIDVDGSPYNFEVFTIDGITEVVERRETETFFYMSENVAVIKQLTSD